MVRDPDEIFDRGFAAVGNAAGNLLADLLLAGFAGIGHLIKSLTPEDTGLHLPLSARFEHMHVVAGSGHGKTQLIQYLLATEDLPVVARGQRSVVVIDSQGDLLRNILSLAYLSPKRASLSERLVLIDPNDIDYPPALNLFDFGLDRLSSYTSLEREKLINGAISLYEYLFSSLLGAELTHRQGVIFRYLGHLLMAVPGATVYTLMDFMEEPARARPYLERLDYASRRFFETQFFSPIFDSTRQQILTRLWGVLSTTTIARMFSHRENKVDLLKALNRGSLILINTAKDLLKQEGCELFGRFMVALLSQAVQERSAIPENRRLPSFVYIDEAQDYFAEGAGIESLVNTARKYKVGLILANQNLGQLGQRLLASVMASTGVKMAGGVSADDARSFAREMNCLPEFVQGMRKTGGATHFALFIRNVTETPISRTIPLGVMERMPRMKQDELEELIAENRERYSAPVEMDILKSSPAVSHAGASFQLAAPQAV